MCAPKDSCLCYLTVDRAFCAAILVHQLTLLARAQYLYMEYLQETKRLNAGGSLPTAILWLGVRMCAHAVCGCEPHVLVHDN